MNPRSLLSGLTSYWRWWRLVVLGVALGAVVAALAIENALLSAVFGLVAVLALAQLIALSGARVDRHHEQLRSQSRRLDTVAGRLEEVARGAARVGASALRSGELSLLVPLQPRSNSVGLVRALAEALPAAEIVVIDRTGSATIAPDLVGAMAAHANVSYLMSTSATDIVDDMNEAAALSSASFVVPLSRNTARQDIDAVVALAGAIPGRDEATVGARFSSTDPRFCLLRRDALAAVGGFVDAAGPSGDLIARFRAAGHRVDRGVTSRSHGRRRLQSGRLEPPSIVGSGHDLASMVVVAAGTAPAAQALAERTTALSADACVWLCPADTWGDVSSVVLRSPHRFFRLPPPADWLDDVHVIVALATDDHPEVQRVVSVVTDSGQPRVIRADGLDAGQVAAEVGDGA